MPHVRPVDLQSLSGAATSMGSLPHLDADEAAGFVLTSHPELPAAPSLPTRSAAEGMVAQAAWGVAGVSIGADGELIVDHAALDPDAPLGDTDFTGDAFVGLSTFLDHVDGRPGPVKFQLTGPVTFGLALQARGVAGPLAFAVAGAAVRARAAALLELVARRPESPPAIVFLDEPGLVRAAHPGFPLPASGAVELVAGVLDVLEAGAVTGLHCCGHTDWRLLLRAEPKILSLPVELAADIRSTDLQPFLTAGGWIAWGVVPTDRPLGVTAARLTRTLHDRWAELAQGGCPLDRLRAQALITPACGLATHGVTQAGHVLALATEIAERLRDAAGGTLSLGA